MTQDEPRTALRDETRRSDRATREDPTQHSGATRLRDRDDAPSAATRVRDAGADLSGEHTRPRPPDPARGADGAIGAGSIINEAYRLEELLGVGGMGQVWRATDLLAEQAGDPHRHVALKLFNSDFEGHPDAFRAFQREASKSQQLAHPNIATVHVFAIDRRSGQPYIAMELLEGKPLDRLIRESPSGLAREQALKIVRGLAQGLAYAHSKGIVHCDFKPGNAFVTDAGVPKVLDFGIARLAQAAARAEDSFDAGSLFALTPAYASAEMLEGAEPHPADDVYALGIVAYQLLTGRHPYGGAQADEALREDRRPAPVRGLRRREWRALHRALELRRAERWPDAKAFAESLRAVSPWIPALAGAAAVFAAAAAYSGYQNYIESRPGVPFAELSPATQAEFRREMAAGDYAYQFATGELQGEEALIAMYRDALPQYAAAYALHPKNPEADAALRRSLEFLEEHLDAADPTLRQEAGQTLAEVKGRFPPLARYQPLERLVDQLAE